MLPPFPEEKFILGVIYGGLLWADMNAATPLGARGRSVISLVMLPAACALHQKLCHYPQLLHYTNNRSVVLPAVEALCVDAYPLGDDVPVRACARARRARAWRGRVNTAR